MSTNAQKSGERSVFVPGDLRYDLDLLHRPVRGSDATIGWRSPFAASYFVPPVAASIAWLVLGEVPSIISIVGGLLVIGGVVLVNARGRR
jgi:hypothetical protein